MNMYFFSWTLNILLIGSLPPTGQLCLYCSFCRIWSRHREVRQTGNYSEEQFKIIRNNNTKKEFGPVIKSLNLLSHQFQLEYKWYDWKEQKQEQNRWRFLKFSVVFDFWSQETKMRWYKNSDCLIIAKTGEQTGPVVLFISCWAVRIFSWICHLHEVTTRDTVRNVPNSLFLFAHFPKCFYYSVRITYRVSNTTVLGSS